MKIIEKENVSDGNNKEEKKQQERKTILREETPEDEDWEDKEDYSKKEKSVMKKRKQTPQLTFKQRIQKWKKLEKILKKVERKRWIQSTSP